MNNRRISIATVVALAAVAAAQQPDWKEAGEALKRFRVEKELKAELWAAEPFVVNPVCFGFDESGRLFLVETNRFGGGTQDIRGHMKWLKQDLASRTVEERDKLQRRMFGKNHDAELARQTERVRLIEDSDGDGRADRYTIFAEDFKTSLSGLAAGILPRKGNVWLANIPDLWLLRDTSGDGVADERVSLQYGYGVRNAFLGHDLHGPRFGPDGKLYLSMGDRGLHVSRTPDGRVVSNPDSGAVLRCNPDGTELELFATGLRNPQDLVFDAYGNLWTGDNNCDRGDAARLVYVVEGGDSGWRIAYQTAKPTAHDVLWHAEKLWHLPNKDQPAYLTPPVAHIGAGPSGIAYYPGVGLPSRYDGTFLLADFRGGKTGSGVHAFKVKPKGAGFEMINRRDFVWDLCATDVKFGYDGAIYISDWVEGWSKPNKGRIYRFFHPETIADPLVAQTRQLIAEGMERRSADELARLLAHADLRVRMEAQFELAARGEKSVPALAAAAAKSDTLFARLHGIWGLGQLRRSAAALAALRPLLKDADAEVRAQTVQVLGERRAADAYNDMALLLKDGSARVRFFAAIALGKLGRKEALTPILEMANDNADKDPYLRHAAVMGLAHLGDVPTLAAASKSTLAPVRMASLLALRKLRRPEIAVYLFDPEAAIVTEAARAIYDESIEAAFPQLAALVNNPNCPPAAMPRALNACLRVGGPQAAAALAAYAARTDAPEKLRAEALALLAEWPSPDWRDRVVGHYQELPERPAAEAATALRRHIVGILRGTPELVKVESVRAAAALGMKETSPLLLELFRDTKAPPTVRAEVVKALVRLESPVAAQIVSEAAGDASEVVRAEGAQQLERLPDAAAKLEQLASAGPLSVRQIAVASLARVRGREADEAIGRFLDQLLAGRLAAELQLDVLEAAAARKDKSVQDKLKQIESARPQNDPLGPFRETLVGGNSAAGRAVFFERQEAMCLKCHAVKGEGGTVGPDLGRIGAQRTRTHLLESILFPNKEITPGYENLVLTLKNGSSVSGTLKAETATDLTLDSPEDGTMKISKADILSRARGLSSMPDDAAKALSKRELRDLIEFLASQK